MENTIDEMKNAVDSVNSRIDETESVNLKTSYLKTHSQRRKRIKGNVKKAYGICEITSKEQISELQVFKKEKRDKGTESIFK